MAMQSYEERLPQQLRDVSRAWRALADRRLAPLGLTQAQWRALLYASRSAAPMSQTELAELLGIETPSLVRLLDKLCAAGWLQRKPCPQDRRARRIHVTRHARALIDQIEAVATGIRQELLGHLSQAELQHTVATLGKVQAALEAALNEGGQPGD